MIQTLDQMLFFFGAKSILVNKITFVLTFLKLLADTIRDYSTFFFFLLIELGICSLYVCSTYSATLTGGGKNLRAIP